VFGNKQRNISKNPKIRQMKKFFAIAAIALTVVACNNSGKSDKDAEAKRVADSIEAKRIQDSIDAANATPLPPANDTTAGKDTSAPQPK
jgi:hypothetical protein